jgi:hypothetical protein
MKANKMKFSKGIVLMFLSVNWAVMILLTSYFVNDKDAYTPILWTLVIGFILQLGFLSDQLNNSKN